MTRETEPDIVSTEKPVLTPPDEAPAKSERSVEAAAPPEWDAFAERIALIAILAIAALMRLVDLGLRPLQPEEADLALRSWSLSRGEPANLAGNPLLVNVGAAVMFALGGDDGVVRLLPAVAGIVMVWLAWSLRTLLGRVGALATAFLLAISPTTVYLSRSFNSAMLTGTLLLAAIVLVVAYAQQRRIRHIYALAVVVGLLLNAGPLTWMAVVVLVAALGLHGALSDIASPRGAIGIAATPLSPLLGYGSPTKILPEPATLRRAAGVGAGVAVLVTTGLITNLGGVQTGFVDSVAAWWSGVVTPGDWPGWYYLFYLLSYDTPALLIGIPAAIVLIRRRSALALFLALWAGESFVLTSLAGSRGPEGALLTVLPLLLLGGMLVEDLVRALRQREIQIQLVVYLLAAVVVSGLSYIAVSARAMPGSAVPIVVVLTPLVGATLLMMTAMSFIGTPRTLLLTRAIAALFSVGIATHATFNLCFDGPGLNPAELVASRATSPDVRNLVADFDHVSQVLLIEGKNRSVAVEAGYQPLLAWYLKDIPGTRFVNRADDGPAIWIASATDGTRPPSSFGLYTGEMYQLTRESTVHPSSWEQWWRWWTLREPPGRTKSSNVMLYVKAQ